MLGQRGSVADERPSPRPLSRERTDVSAQHTHEPESTSWARTHSEHVVLNIGGMVERWCSRHARRSTNAKSKSVRLAWTRSASTPRSWSATSTSGPSLPPSIGSFGPGTTASGVKPCPRCIRSRSWPAAWRKSTGASRSIPACSGSLRPVRRVGQVAPLGFASARIPGERSSRGLRSGG